MTFHALLISLDDSSAELLGPIFAELLIAAERCLGVDATSRLEERRFDLTVIDLENSSPAQSIPLIRQCRGGKTSLILGLASSFEQAANGFAAGANFILSKPVSREHAVAVTRAIVALVKRERRRQFRVPVQLPVTLGWDGAAEVEGILLDLSEGGMDVLSAKPLEVGQHIGAQFSLASIGDIQIRGQVMWANANGQTGLQLLDLTEEQRRAISEWLVSNAPQAPPEDAEPLNGYKVSDLSPGGCYIETVAPFPKGTRVDLYLHVGEAEAHLDGTVRVVHPTCGMGVEFARSNQLAEQVEKFIDVLLQRPGVAPELLVAPKSINVSDRGDCPGCGHAELNDALLHLLHENAHLTQQEFLAELRSQRHSPAEATTV